MISPHGFGHAARSAAVLNALHRVRPDAEPHLFTTVPRWFWDDSLDGPFEYHEVVTDVGLVQRSPVEEDPAATLAALEELRPFEVAARPLARSLRDLGCDRVVCDISPLGLAAARVAGIPSVLIESFTWDWIYGAYFEAEPGLRSVATEMAELFDSADLRIQTEPVSRPVPGSITVRPVHRTTRTDAAEVRRALAIGDDRPLVVLTMGGAEARFGFLERLGDVAEVIFAAFVETPDLERRGNVLLMPYRSPVYLPDLIAAADLVVGKLGYSTVAEAWAAGTRYAYVPRPSFPEGPSLAEFITRSVPTLEIEADDFATGDWLHALPTLLARPRPEPRTENGARAIASHLIEPV